MTCEIEIDEKTDKAKSVFEFLDQHQIKYNPNLRLKMLNLALEGQQQMRNWRSNSTAIC